MVSWFTNPDVNTNAYNFSWALNHFSVVLIQRISHSLVLSPLHYQAVAALQQQQPQQQPVQPAAPPVALDTHPMNLTSPAPPTDPMARKQVVQDLMAQMQGTYNFMQVWI